MFCDLFAVLYAFEQLLFPVCVVYAIINRLYNNNRIFQRAPYFRGSAIMPYCVF